MESNSRSNGTSSERNASGDPQAFKLAVAVALLRFQQQQQRSSSPSEDAQQWKRKAKERKRELLRLREEFNKLEDGVEKGAEQGVFSQIVSCSCHFFDGCGELGAKRIRLGVVGDGDGGNGGGGSGHEHWIDEVLRRRFLRHVRWNERRKRSDGSIRRSHLIELNTEDEIQQLSSSADFLVEFSDSISPVNINHDMSNSSFAALAHQAVDFILASVKCLLSLEKNNELVEEIIKGLIMHLIKRMCCPSEQGALDAGSDVQFYVQHIIRRLGNVPYVGHRIMLSVSKRICILADNLLLMDPFDDAFPDMHDWMFMMIQLIELLISEYIQSWTSGEDLDCRLLEEWLRSVLQARKALELLECRNGLYILYMERVIGELVKQLGPLSCQGKLDIDVLSLLC